MLSMIGNSILSLCFAIFQILDDVLRSFTKESKERCQAMINWKYLRLIPRKSPNTTHFTFYLDSINYHLKMLCFVSCCFLFFAF